MGKFVSKGQVTFRSSAGVLRSQEEGEGTAESKDLPWQWYSLVDVSALHVASCGQRYLHDYSSQTCIIFFIIHPDNAFYLLFQANVFREMSELCCEVQLFLKEYILIYVTFKNHISFAEF